MCCSHSSTSHTPFKSVSMITIKPLPSSHNNHLQELIINKKLLNFDKYGFIEMHVQIFRSYKCQLITRQTKHHTSLLFGQTKKYLCSVQNKASDCLFAIWVCYSFKLSNISRNSLIKECLICHSLR